MGKKPKRMWRPVPLELFSSPLDIDGLIGIEELSDYRIENRRDLKRKINKGKEGKAKESVPCKKKKKETVCKDLAANVKEGKIKKDICREKVLLQKKKKQKSISVKEAKVNKQPSEFEVLTEQEYLSRVPHGMEAWGCCHVPLPVIKALQDLGYDKPTEIQSLTLPAAIKGRRDILGAAETGSGKTLAFGIPIIYGILMQKRKEAQVASSGELAHNEDFASDEEDDNLIDNELVINFEPHSISTPRKRLYALILTPTRELAIQVRNHLVAAAKYTDIKIATVLGGMAPQKQERLLKRGPEIVVATPGRLWDMIQEGNPHLQQVGDISFLAIDETDRMLEKGHFQELQQILERINIDPEKKKRRQTFVFSATLTLVHEPPKYINKRNNSAHRVTPGQKLQEIISSLGITQPKIVDVTSETGTARSLSEARIVCQFDEKDFYLSYFLQQHKGRTLVFCNSISCVRRLAQILGILQCKPLPLHANMQQRQRLKNLEHFRDRENGLLLATDVAARGLDIPDVEHVIHYQVPRTSEIYVHRSGRTARAKKEGLTLIIMEPTELQCYLRICNALGKNRDLPDFPVDGNILSAVKKRVIIARKLDQLELQYKKKTAKANWFHRAVEEMDLVLDEDEMPDSFSSSETADIKRQLKALRQELQGLLGSRIFPGQMSFKYPTKYEQVKESSPEKATEVIKNMKRKPGSFVKLPRQKQ